MPAAGLHPLLWPDGGGGGDPPVADATTQFSGWQIVTLMAALLLILRV